MTYVYMILEILGGMGALLVGMKMLSENLTRLAHNKLQALLNKTAKNRFACVGIGTAVTVLGQSSAFTTVMVVGLVNAGIMTLFQATAMIMGANIGTTFVTWIVSLSGVEFTTFFLLFAAVGALMVMISKQEKIKSIGSALAGFGIIFVGLMVMKGAMAFEAGSPQFEAISSVFKSIKNPFLILFIGIALTALVQSSTAVNAIIISLAGVGIFIGGANAGNAMYFLIIGSNIGTCVTALLSSIGATPNAKRAALIHFMFNFFGAVIFMIILLAWSGFADTLLTPAFPENREMCIALFHTIFNVICTLIFVPFINLFVKLANLIVRDGKKAEEGKEKVPALSAPAARLLTSPSLALGYLYQETGKLFTFAMDTLDVAFQAFGAKDVSAKERVLKENAELASANRNMTEYLVKVSATALSLQEEKTVSSLHYVLNDIVRIGELADNVTKYTAHYVDDELTFSDDFFEMLDEMYMKIKSLYVLSLATFLYKDFSRLAEVDKLEDEIDKDRKLLISKHIERLNEGKCQPQNSSVFINLVGNLERTADHITFIAHSIEQNN